MAIGTVASRVTGFLRLAMLVAVLGVGGVRQAFEVSNTLPNSLYDLLVGGVLASTLVPVLVQARAKDQDGAYVQRLLTLVLLGMGARAQQRGRHCHPRPVRVGARTASGHAGKPVGRSAGVPRGWHHPRGGGDDGSAAAVTTCEWVPLAVPDGRTGNGSTSPWPARRVDFRLCPGHPTGVSGPHSARNWGRSVAAVCHCLPRLAAPVRRGRCVGHHRSSPSDVTPRSGGTTGPDAP